MLFYNDVLYGAFRHAYGSENLLGFSAFVMKEESKSRHRLDQLRKNVKNSLCLKSLIMLENEIEK